MDAKAKLIRRVSGTASLEATLRNAVQALETRGIPSLVVGGYAVQEHGYARFTADLDLVVPDVGRARGVLPEWVEINLLPGNQSARPGPLKLPMPTEMTKNPHIVDLRTLIEIKLSGYMGAPFSRLKDAADVVELIKANQLPENFELEREVREAYRRLWTCPHDNTVGE